MTLRRPQHMVLELDGLDDEFATLARLKADISEQVKERQDEVLRQSASASRRPLIIEN